MYGCSPHLHIIKRVKQGRGPSRFRPSAARNVLSTEWTPGKAERKQAGERVHCNWERRGRSGFPSATVGVPGEQGHLPRWPQPNVAQSVCGGSGGGGGPPRPKVHRWKSKRPYPQKGPWKKAGRRPSFSSDRHSWWEKETTALFWPTTLESQTSGPMQTGVTPAVTRICTGQTAAVSSSGSVDSASRNVVQGGVCEAGLGTSQQARSAPCIQSAMRRRRFRSMLPDHSP